MFKQSFVFWKSFVVENVMILAKGALGYADFFFGATV